MDGQLRDLGSSWIPPAPMIEPYWPQSANFLDVIWTHFFSSCAEGGRGICIHNVSCTTTHYMFGMFRFTTHSKAIRPHSSSEIRWRTKSWDSLKDKIRPHSSSEIRWRTKLSIDALFRRHWGALKVLLRLYYGAIDIVKRRRRICSRTKLDRSGKWLVCCWRKEGGYWSGR